MTNFPEVNVLPCGSQGLRLSKLGLGCMGMSAFYIDVPVGVEEAAPVVNRALELGVTHLDTASLYGWGHNEELLGQIIKDRRDKFVIASKCGFVKGPNDSLVITGTRQHVRETCEASLRRLGVDCIDLYYLHRVDPNTPLEETFLEFKALISEGKIKYAGISEATADQIRRAHAVCPLSAVQIEWSLWSRQEEAEVIPTCRELGIGIVTYSPLGKGFLTGCVTKDMLAQKDTRRIKERFHDDAIAHNTKLIDAMRHMAARKGVKPGQLALAWLNAQGDDVFPIPGSDRVTYLEENVQSLSVTLTQEEMRELEEIVAPEKVMGSRF